MKPRPYSEQDIDLRMARMSASAETIRLRLQDREKEPISPNDPTYPKADAIRWTLRHLDYCSSLFKRPPPSSLVDLAEHLYGVSKEPGGNPKPPEFWQAAEYIAAHPNARDNRVAKAVGKSNHTIKNWRADSEFAREVESCRCLIEFGTE